MNPVQRGSGGFRVNRTVPTAYAAAARYPASAGRDRTIVLSTGRGDVRISPDEARRLAAELIRLANVQAPTNNFEDLT